MGANHPNNMSTLKKQWKKKYPADNGFYICWICKQPVADDKVSVDHVLPVADYPEYAKELSNMRPAHQWCNEERHAKSLEKFRKRKVIGIYKWR